MPTITSCIKIAAAVLGACSLFACSSGNGDGNAPLVDSSGKHAAGWLNNHWVEYNKSATADTSPCAECHGNDLLGGISKVSCFSADRSGQSCHAGALGHPVGWASPVADNFHGKATFNGKAVKGSLTLTTDCGGCHSFQANGTSSAPSCLSAGIGGISCHATSPAANPTGCKSCHATPPDSSSTVGTTTPNRQFGHGAHLFSYTDSTINSCSVCHFGAGTGTSNHSKLSLKNLSTATVALSASFSVRGATASYDADSKKCSNISCHGGQITPSWEGGAVNLGCTQCHNSKANNPQAFNSYSSGKMSTFSPGKNMHEFHLTLTGFTAAVCTDCHSAAKLPKSTHFSGLDTPAFNTAPASTIGGGDTKVPNDYAADGRTCLTSAGCHQVAPTVKRSWF